MPRPPHLRPPIAGKRAEDGADRAISELAERQHGVVSRRQLIWLGYTRHEIDRRIGSGMLHIVHRGVYAVGHRRLTREGRWFAALLAAGPDAVLSHESAAVLWQLRDREQVVEISVARRRRPRSGLRIHEARLRTSDITTRHGIPVTTPLRTLLDLAQTLDPEPLEEAIRQAEYRRLTSAAFLSRSLSSRHGEPGVNALRRALEKADLGQGPTRKGFEQRFLRDHGIARPKFNAPMEVGGRRIEVDCLWAKQRLVVELDGGAAHMTTAAFHADRARDQNLVAAGFRVIRLTWRQLMDEPGRMAEVLRRLLSPVAEERTKTLH